MKGIRNLNLTKAAATLLLAGSMSLSLSSCVGSVDLDSVTADALLSNPEVANVTMMDEMIDNGGLLYSEDLNIVEAADKLERCMDVVELLKNEDFSGADQLQPLTDEQYRAVEDYSLEDIETLRIDARYKGNDLASLERKLNAIKKLNYLYSYCNNWIHENGQDVSIEFMMASVKSAVGSELNVDPEDYSSIVIPKLTSYSMPESNFIEVGNDRYEIKTSSEEIWNTVSYIYALQDYDPENGNEIETYRKAINYAKTTLAAGANVKNNRIEEQYSASYIKKNYVK